MTTIPLTPVKSSNITAVGYENGTLAVKFSSGSVYHYEGVPTNVYAELIAAESVEVSLGQNILDLSIETPGEAGCSNRFETRR